MRLQDRVIAPRKIAQRAVIDIGSNTVRLVIYDGPVRAPEVFLNEKVTARLGRGLGETGVLSEKSMAAALAGLNRFATLLRLQGVKDVQIAATAAVRDAANGAAFLEQVRALGLDARLLSGEEEAVTSAMGVLSAFPGATGVVADLGGGSLELVDIDGAHCEHGVSLPLGTLRLPQLRVGGGVKFTQRVRKALKTADWAGGEGQPLYLVGGSYRAMARYAMREMDWPIDDPHGFEIEPDDLLRFCRAIARTQVLPEIPGITPSRLASLPDAAALLNALVRQIKPSHLVFSAWGLREGLLYRELTPEGRTQDPLISGVAAFTESLGSPAATAMMIAGWSAPANPGSGHSSSGGRHERLRLAATMLALASHRIEPNLRAEHAMDWALRKRWIGLDAEGRAMIAAADLANAGRFILPPQLTRLASEARLKEAQTWGLATRLARRFSGALPLALANSALSVTRGKLLLSVREAYASLCTDVVTKDMKLLANHLGRQPKIRFVKDDAEL